MSTHSYDRDESLYWWPSLVENLLKHSERIQELCLDVPVSFLPPKLTLCAPRLEKLVLDGFSMESIAIIGGDKFPLHTLKLYNCSLPWYSLNLTGLKKLFLHRVHSPSPLNMVKFLAVLSSMQNLTALHLSRVLPSARDFLSSGGLCNSPKIDLPHLTRLVIAEPLSTLVALLSCVSIPPRTALDLELGFESGSSLDDFVPISSFLAQRFSQQSSGPTFRSLLLRSGYLDSLAFGLECEPPQSVLEEVRYDIPLRITFMVKDEDTGEIVLMENDTDCVISNIFSSLPLTNIQSLHVTEMRQFPSDFWRGILGRLDGLRYMKLSHGHMPDLSLLSLAHESNENPGEQPIPDQDLTSCHMFVPGLEELEFHRITFTPDHMSLQGRMSQKSFIDTLSTRKGLQLIMTECK